MTEQEAELDAMFGGGLTEFSRPIVEDEKTRAWRELELLRAGFHPLHAATLAGFGDVDLHEACALVSGGCDSETAVRILL